MAKKKQNCKNLLELFDEIEMRSQEIFDLCRRGLTIQNDVQALHRIIREIKEKL